VSYSCTYGFVVGVLVLELDVVLDVLLLLEAGSIPSGRFPDGYVYSAGDGTVLLPIGVELMCLDFARRGDGALCSAALPV